jgi:hypothetical protein
MADERRLEIRERAGLEEARLNQDFIDFLRKFSTPVLLIFALLAVGWAVYERRTQAKQLELSAAFQELEAARSGANPNPDTLITIADTYASSGAVPILARLEAGDIFLDALRRNAVPGAEVAEDGTIKPEDLLTDATRADMLNKAREQYDAALTLARSSDSFTTHKIAALYGLAAVAESDSKWDEAKANYEQIRSAAEAAGFADDVKIAQERIATLPTLSALAALPRKDQVPAVLDTTPKPPEAPTMPQAGLSLTPPPAEKPAEQPAPTEVKPAETTPAQPPAQPEPIPGEPKKPE